MDKRLTLFERPSFGPRDDARFQDAVLDRQNDKKGEPESPEFDPGSPYSPRTLWDDIDLVDSQRSSPTLLENEDPWELPPSQMSSPPNDTMLYSPSLEGVSPKYGDPYGQHYSDCFDLPHYTNIGDRVSRKPVGPRASKVNSDFLSVRNHRLPSENQPLSETPWDSLELDNTAREHPLYHNVTPKADGLYHCPFEDDPKSNCPHKPEKLKCNYEYASLSRIPPNKTTLTPTSSKFVDSHLKPYRCKVPNCEYPGLSSTACLLRHEREAHAMHGHGDKPFLCTYEDCERGVPGNGFPRHWNLRDHMKRVHNDPGQPKSPSVSPPSEFPKGKKRKAGDYSLFAEKSERRIATSPSTSHQPEELSLVERFKEQRQILLETVAKLKDPRNPEIMVLLRKANDCIKVMIQISQHINSAP